VGGGLIYPRLADVGLDPPTPETDVPDHPARRAVFLAALFVTVAILRRELPMVDVLNVRNVARALGRRASSRTST